MTSVKAHSLSGPSTVSYTFDTINILGVSDNGTHLDTTLYKEWGEERMLDVLCYTDS